MYNRIQTKRTFMLLFISILLIIGLKMSYLWFIPAVIIWLLAIKNTFGTIADNQRLIAEQLVKMRDK